MHRTRIAGSVGIAKYEYSNNTLESSACISGKSQDLYRKGPANTH